MDWKEAVRHIWQAKPEVQAARADMGAAQTHALCPNGGLSTCGTTQCPLQCMFHATVR